MGSGKEKAMTISEQKKIFSNNLANLIEKSGKQQKEVASELGYSYTTLNTWVRGTSMPNTAKIQRLADYFGVLKSDLLDEKEVFNEEDEIERHMKIRTVSRYLSELIGCDASEITALLIQLNENGLVELQKRVSEMLCVSAYRRELEQDSDLVFTTVDEDGIKKYDALGRIIPDDGR